MSRRPARKRRRRRSSDRGGRRLAVRAAGALVALGLGTFVVWEAFFLRIGELRDPKSVRTIHVPVPGENDRALVVGPANPWWTPLDHVSDAVVLCVLKSEDDRFWEHDGFDWKQLRRSFEENLEEGRFARGGSTVTMQLAKNLFLWREKSLLRKALEIYLTLRLEASLPKERILELYLNVVEWGPDVYGIGEASRHYFGKAPSALTIGEGALLAVTLPNPVEWNPKRAPDLALERSMQLLGRIHREGGARPVRTDSRS